MFIESSYISSYYTILLLLLLPLNIFSMNFDLTCDLLKLPRECHCQRIRHISLDSVNETRLRCRQLTEVTTTYHWSQLPYDRLAFETFNDNLTFHRFVLANIIVRSLRIQAQHLFFQDHTFDKAYIGQLSISNYETYAGIDFEIDGQIFYGTTITNLHFKSIDFQTPISELIFSHAKIYILLIQSSKFHGFLNKKVDIISKPLTKMKYDQFLEYDFLTSPYPRKFHSYDESSTIEPEQTVMMNITSNNYPIYLTIFSIISSIHTSNLTENYFPNNLEYNQLEEIELSCNEIHSLHADVFRHLKQFKGRLILKNNQIKSLDSSALDHLFLLKNLSLANNFIQNFSSRHFQDLQQLEELDISSNEIIQLTNHTFAALSSLQILYLNSNPLEFIAAETFSNLTNLKQIYFRDVQLLHFIEPEYFQWIWHLASVHVFHLLQNDFDLSDVAFCILSQYNQTLIHLSRQHSCSCNIHYFNLNENFTDNTSMVLSKYQTNYLRLTPICHENHTEGMADQQINENDFILRNFENQCDYKLMFLDCDAMTTTTIQATTTTTTLTEMEIESTVPTDVFISSIKEIPRIPSKSRGSNLPSSRKTSLHNMKKLFTVLGTLVAITIGAIILVFFWFRFKSNLKRRKKKQSFVEQQHFNSPAINNHHSTVPRYASSEMSGSIYSAQLSTSKSQSEALIDPGTSTISKSIHSNPMEKFLNEQNSQQDSIENKSIEMQTVTQC